MCPSSLPSHPLQVMEDPDDSLPQEMPVTASFLSSFTPTPPPPPPLPTLPQQARSLPPQVHSLAPLSKSTPILQELDDLLTRLERESKMKSGVENMLEVYIKDKRRTKDLEAQLEQCLLTIETITKEIERIRTQPGKESTGITEKLKTFHYTTTPFPVTKTTRTRTKGRSNSSPNIKGKHKVSQENFSFPDDDAWPIGKRLHHLVFQLRTDDWRQSKPGQPTDPAASKESKLEKLTVLLRILKNTADVDLYYPKRGLVTCLRQCIASPTKEVRIMALRTLRHLVEGPADVELIVQMQVGVFITRALARDSESHEMEREQTLKLVRSFIEYDGVKFIDQSVVRAVVAIAEQTDCRLRNISLETLAELSILDIGLTVRSGGLRILIQALLDGHLTMTEVLIQAVLFVLDTPDRRCYLRPGVELEMIIAPFTESNQGTNYEERLKNSARVVTLLLKNWAGIFYMCANNMRAARSVVQALRVPTPDTQKLVLDMFLDIFRVKLPKDYNNYLSGRQHTVHIDPSVTEPVNRSPRIGLSVLTSGVTGELMLAGGMPVSAYDRSSGSTTASNSERLKMLYHHLSIILIIFIESDILMALVDMVKSDDVYISRKATLLIGEILQLSTRLLPMSMGTQVQSLPKLFALASNFDDEHVRHNATAALAHIDKLTRVHARYVTPTPTKGERIANSIRTQEKVHEVKLKIGYAIDDTHFRQLLMDSQVLNTKDYTKWNWESIIELLQGPLLNPRRLDEAMRGKTFIRRLLTFYRPSKHQFSDLHATKANVARYVKHGCTLLSTLLGHLDGVRYLGEHKLLNDIADALSELGPLNGNPENEPVFSKERMESTLCAGYFTLLGTLSKHKEGVRMLEKFKLFSLFYQLSELRSRDDLKVAMITNLDYTLNGHPRVLLSKIMTSGYNPIRLFATQYLGIIMRQSESEYNGWAIRLLVTQLYDTHLEVCQEAVSLLDEACERPANLELLVKFRPSLGHLGEIGNPLLLRFLSTSTGFRYLNVLGYVDKEMDEWFEYRNRHYVTQLELSLARALVNTPDKKSLSPFEERIDSENDFEGLQPGDGLTPPHFYGELTKTEEGCSLLRERGHFQLFANYLREHSLEKQDMEVLQHLKAVLWAVGNIGATRNGLPFLEEEDIVKDIVAMAESNEVLSLKGTCYYVLGLISKTRQGMELLGELGWEGVLGHHGVPEGLCVPLNLRVFLTIRNWKYSAGLSKPPRLPLSVTKDEIASDILKNIGDMGNHILANEASKNLAKLRQRYSDCFQRVDVYYAVCQLLGSYHFRSPVRKYVLEIFDMRFTPELLLSLDEVATQSKPKEDWSNNAPVFRTAQPSLPLQHNEKEQPSQQVQEQHQEHQHQQHQQENTKQPPLSIEGVAQERLTPKSVRIGFHLPA